jgi:hypothetical protein
VNTTILGLVLTHLAFWSTEREREREREGKREREREREREKTNISFCEVPSLDHEIFNNTVKGTSFETITFLSCIKNITISSLK